MSRLTDEGVRFLARQGVVVMTLVRIVVGWGPLIFVCWYLEDTSMAIVASVLASINGATIASATYLHQLALKINVQQWARSGDPLDSSRFLAAQRRSNIAELVMFLCGLFCALAILVNGPWSGWWWAFAAIWSLVLVLTSTPVQTVLDATGL